MKLQRTMYKVVETYAQAREVIFNKAHDVIGWREIEGGKLDVAYKMKSEAVARNNSSSPIIGNFVTQLARMKLFEKLHQHSDKIAYCVGVFRIRSMLHLH